MGRTNTKKNWDYGQVNLPATITVYKVVELEGGSSVTIKALAGNSGRAYVGSDSLLTTANGFELDAGETVTLTLPITFGRDNFIIIYAVTDNATDNLCYIKLIDEEPETKASS